MTRGQQPVPTVTQSDEEFNFEDYPFYDEIFNKNGDSPIATTYWTDIFIYWFDQPEVIEGSILAFFSDLNPELTEQSICYGQFKRTRSIA